MIGQEKDVMQMTLILLFASARLVLMLSGICLFDEVHLPDMVGQFPPCDEAQFYLINFQIESDDIRTVVSSHQYYP